MVDRIADSLGIDLRKPWFRPYLYGRGGIRGIPVHLAKPLTFMNRSGDAVPDILHRAGVGIDGLLVVCDTMDLPAGKLRLKTRGGSAGHNGLKSLISILGTEDFMRLYVGIGRPVPGSDVVSHVLGVPEADEERELLAAVDRAADGIVLLPTEGPEGVMNEINRT